MRFTVVGLFLFAAGTMTGTTFVQISAQHDNNTNLAIREQKPDSSLSGLFEYSNLRPVNEKWQAGFGARLQSTAWQEYTGLNLTEIGANLAASRKYGLGPVADQPQSRAPLRLPQTVSCALPFATHRGPDSGKP
jgi:hypothetical protein